MPLLGDGDLVVTGTGAQGQVLPIGTIYLAAYNATTPVAAPEARLGDTEPASAWVRVGCLNDDMFDLQETDPQIIEYRRGFRMRYYGEVTRTVGQRTVVAEIIEVQPQIIAALMGESTTAETGGVSLNLSSSVFVDKSMLVVYKDAQNSREYHLYNPHVRARYKFSKVNAGGGNASFLSLQLTLKLITFKVGNDFKDVTYYEWDNP